MRTILAVAFILFPGLLWAQVDPVALRSIVMSQTLSALESKSRSSPSVKEKSLLPSNAGPVQTQPKAGQVKPLPAEKTSQPPVESVNANKGLSRAKNALLKLKGDAYMTLGLELGYIKGFTSYDFDHHTSELEYPLNNFMGGGTAGVGYKGWLAKAEVWMPFESYAGDNMKDKDWILGDLVSYTKSKAYLDAVIVDGSLQYEFFRKDFPNTQDDIHDNSSPIFRTYIYDGDKIRVDSIRASVLVGYRYEHFDFDMYDLHDVNTGVSSYLGTKVLGYHIKYYIPYIGFEVEAARNPLAFGGTFKFGIHPTARDYDNHFLRGLAFFAKYRKDGQAFMCNLWGRWNFARNWKLGIGADGTFVRIDGVTWDSTNDPTWDKDQNTDMRHWIFWSGLEYTF